jgi:hypothetical protein
VSSASSVWAFRGAQIFQTSSYCQVNQASMLRYKFSASSILQQS